MRRLIVAVVAVAACGPGRSSPDFRLALANENKAADGGEPRITMQAGDSKLLELIVIGSVPGPVVFAGKDLPAFVTLEGPLLTIAPTLRDAGTYQLVLTATSRGESRQSILDLIVTRFNTPPRIEHDFNWSDDTGNRGYEPWMCPNPWLCTLYGTPHLFVYACDDEGDARTFDVEVVQQGQSFTGKPTYTVTQPAAASANCDYAEVVLTGLTREQSYQFAVRLTDELGAVADKYSGAAIQLSQGWIRSPLFGFDAGPCTTRQCACMPSGTNQPPCNTNADCCSGACSPQNDHCN